MLPYPVIDNDELAKIIHINDEGALPGFQPHVVRGLYPVAGGGEALAHRLEEICQEVSQAIEDGARIIVLSDRGADAAARPDPVAAAHRRGAPPPIREKTRTRVGLVVETGEARECHHMALLIGYGASAINPYLAIETVLDLIAAGKLDVPPEKAVRNMIKAYGKGILKIMSKMGVSTVASYTGAQIFEALGLGPEVIERCFTGTTSRLGGIGLRRDRRGGRPPARPRLPAGGEPAPAAGGRRRVPVAARGRAAPVQPGDRLQAPARHPQPAGTRSSRSTPPWWTPSPSG